MKVVPIGRDQAAAFVLRLHRHSKPPRAFKFGIGLRVDETLVGVAVAARPSARELDDGTTLEITRTCTDGTRNANSRLYGAVWRAARAMGYVRGITYTEESESGASLRACGWRPVAVLPARGDWAHHAGARRARQYRQRELFESDKPSGGRRRIRWEITCPGICSINRKHGARCAVPHSSATVIAA